MLLPCLPTLLAATYVVAPTGDDAASGIDRPWRTLARASRAEYRTGDRLLLVGTLPGTLRLKDVRGLTIASKGARARIDAGSGDGLVVEGGTDVRIENLEIAGAGRKANDGKGLALAKVAGARVSRVEASGFRLGGIEVDGCSGVVLENDVVRDDGAAGIAVAGGYDGLPRSRDVTILACRAVDNPGDPKNLGNHSGNGIIVGGVDGCLIEACEAARNGWDMPRKGNGPVGIWAWNASRVTIRGCVSHENDSPGTDGGGFDLDGGVTDSLIEGNLSYGNAGAGYLLCQYTGAGEWRGNVVRNNVSFEDGRRNFHSGVALYLPEGMTNMTGGLVERNTVVNSRFAVATEGDVPGMVYRRNVLVGREAVRNVAWGPGGFKGSRFEANLESPNDPHLRLPSSIKELPTDPRKLAAMPWFRPLPNAPDDKIAYGARL